MKGFNPRLYIGITIIILAIGIWASGQAEIIFQKIDPKEVVIDEIVGMLISLYLLPFSWYTVTSAFILFRFLDITKPFRFLEKLPGGWGIMMDDAGAAVATNMILRIIL